MFDCILDRLQPQQTAACTLPHRAVAGTDDAGAATACARVHDQCPAIASQSGLLGQFAIGDDADPDDDQVCRKHAPVRGVDGSHHAATAAQCADVGAQFDGRAVVSMQAKEEVRELRADDARHQPIGRLQHNDLLAEPPGDGGEFQPDEAATDHHHLRGVRQDRGKRASVGHVAQHADMAEPGAWDLRPAGACAGGKTQPRVAQGAAVIQVQRAGGVFDAHRPLHSSIPVRKWLTGLEI